jgi:hypothetical protein
MSEPMIESGLVPKWYEDCALAEPTSSRRKGGSASFSATPARPSGPAAPMRSRRSTTRGVVGGRRRHDHASAPAGLGRRAGVGWPHQPKRPPAAG